MQRQGIHPRLIFDSNKKVEAILAPANIPLSKALFHLDVSGRLLNGALELY